MVGLQNLAFKTIDATSTPNPISDHGILVVHGIHSEDLEVSLLNQMGQNIVKPYLRETSQQTKQFLNRLRQELFGGLYYSNYFR